MSLEKNQIITVVTPVGEFIGRLVEDDATGITLSNPRMIVFGENQNMGFAHGIAATGNSDPKEMKIRHAVFITEANDDVQKAWTEQTSGLIV